MRSLRSYVAVAGLGTQFSLLNPTSQVTFSNPCHRRFQSGDCKYVERFSNSFCPGRAVFSAHSDVTTIGGRVCDCVGCDLDCPIRAAFRDELAQGKYSLAVPDAWPRWTWPAHSCLS